MKQPVDEATSWGNNQLLKQAVDEQQVDEVTG